MLIRDFYFGQCSLELADRRSRRLAPGALLKQKELSISAPVMRTCQSPLPPSSCPQSLRQRSLGSFPGSQWYPLLGKGPQNKKPLVVSSAVYYPAPSQIIVLGRQHRSCLELRMRVYLLQQADMESIKSTRFSVINERKEKELRVFEKLLASDSTSS